MNQKFANLSRALLAQSVDTSDTQFSIKNAVEVPSLSTGEFFIATIFTIGSDYGTNIEIVKVVQVDGNLWTVERGQEDTTAKEHPQDSRIELRLTAGALSNIYNDIDTKVDKVVGQGLSDSNYTQAEKDKLDGIALEATKNRADSANADKVHTHTMTQVTGLDDALLTKFDKTSLVQSTGQSSEKVMSQKAVTDVIANIPPVSKSSAYTVVEADKGKSIDTTSDVTIPASVFAVGDVIVVTNTSATDSSILAASGVTIRLAGSTKTGTLTLVGYGVATLRMVTSNNWFASGAGLN